MNWKVVLREDRLSKLEEEMNSKKDKHFTQLDKRSEFRGKK